MKPAVFLVTVSGGCVQNVEQTHGEEYQPVQIFVRDFDNEERDDKISIQEYQFGENLLDDDDWEDFT